MVVSVDTQKVVNSLTVAGFTREQAEAVTDAVRAAQSIDVSSLVSKSDLQAGTGRRSFRASFSSFRDWAAAPSLRDHLLR
jgi:hypothetical protein